MAAFIRTLHKHNQPPIVFSNADRKRPVNPVSNIEIDSPTRVDLKLGKRLYKKNGCQGCHAINEYGGTSGPDLSTIGSRLDAQKIWQTILDPASVKPDSKMPACDINDENGDLLIAYLLSLKE